LGLSAFIVFATTGIGAGAAAEPGPKVPRVAAAVRSAGPQDVIRAWPKFARAAARAMIAKYGSPQQFDRDTLVWFHNGPWKRTIVHREALRPSVPGGERGALQQTIGYLVPADKIDALRRFNGLIEVSQSAGELSFRSSNESRNFLALNLAEDIVTGRMGVAEARDLFAKTSRLALTGKSSPYLDGLLFEVDNDRVMSPTGGD
jgi:hypothetical protein